MSRAAEVAEPGIRVERQGPVTRIVFDRPHAMNAFTPGMVRALNGALDEFVADPGNRVLVLTGSGRAFCCGADLKFLAAARGEALNRFLRELNRFIDGLDNLDRPVIAAVNGTAMGGGLETMLACDLVLAAEDIVIADPHITVSAIHGAGGSQRLVRSIGLQRALDLVLTARHLTAAEAAAWGLVSRVVAAESLESETIRLAHDLARRDDATVRELKRLVRLSAAASLDVGLAAERQAFQECVARPAFAEAMGRFAAGGRKRPTGLKKSAQLRGDARCRTESKR
ncbi:MAG: enoyl-CoA hydratase/isomerase family protein [Variibacter sp.]|nr:enoyl-CoA hydratase/isomerase family protein [Variibacter sp.]